MKLQLTFTTAIVVLFFSAPAWADAVVVIGDGPERMCYIAAKTGVDPMAGLDHCNLALENGLVPHDRAATFVNRGVIEHKLGRNNAALDDFNACLAMIPDQSDAFINRGVVKLSQGNALEALDDIQKGITLGPSEPALAYFDRGIVYEKLAVGAERQAYLQKAYADYQRAVKEAPEFTAASDALARFRIIPKARAS
jgi:tetratricopeptide (TPR) repeat protein